MMMMMMMIKKEFSAMNIKGSLNVLCLYIKVL
jgi:hypothetical protein